MTPQEQCDAAQAAINAARRAEQAALDAGDVRAVVRARADLSAAMALADIAAQALEREADAARAVAIAARRAEHLALPDVIAQQAGAMAKTAKAIDSALAAALAAVTAFRTQAEGINEHAPAVHAVAKLAGYSDLQASGEASRALRHVSALHLILSTHVEALCQAAGIELNYLAPAAREPGQSAADVAAGVGQRVHASTSAAVVDTVRGIVQRTYGVAR